MKNIHLLPTDKPSILGRFIDTNNLFLRVSNDIPRGENVNIYITSDEEIKNRDCFRNAPKAAVLFSKMLMSVPPFEYNVSNLLSVIVAFVASVVSWSAVICVPVPVALSRIANTIELHASL